MRTVAARNAPHYFQSAYWTDTFTKQRKFVPVPFGYPIWLSHLAIPFGYPIWLSHLAIPFGYPIWLSHLAIPFGYPIWLSHLAIVLTSQPRFSVAT
ncbi:hypothetical protein [Pseudoalteromonas luteoviolacea]|uniref:hypothetical protein n=1 Tax=Pseudoalteromonas luteoviolacea TaxID=43657 RepID=UPI0011AB3F8C|nr:hypothetical protein [Pseudoalteromonas luteoviolacea]